MIGLPKALACLSVAFFGSLFAGSATAGLLFTEYVEGSGNNKALEIYNGTGAPVDLTGYEVRMYFNGSTSAGNVVVLSGVVAIDDVFVLANAAADAAILAVADQTDAAGWYNGDDAVELSDGLVSIDVIGQIGTDPGSEWGVGGSSTGNNTLRRRESVTTGDTDGGDPFDPAAEWDGFGQDVFDGLGAHPGTGSGGITPLSIPAIQGAGHESPVAGTVIETSGIVTAVDSNGFYLQDPVGDGNDDTSDGVFVFTSSAPPVAVGDAVTVTGPVSEFIPGGAGTNNLSITQINGPVVTVDSSGNALPPATILGSAGRLPPTEIIDNDVFAVFDPGEDGIDFYESVEGMRVTVSQAVAISATNRFGETWVVTDNGLLSTGMTPRGGIKQSADDFNPERIQVQPDDDLLPLVFSAATGDVLGDVSGVVSYGFGNFEILLTGNLQSGAGALQQETTALVSDATSLTVATLNVLNLETNAADGDDDVGSGRFAALGEQIAGNLGAPDILGLQEIQDNDGSFDTGVVDAGLTYDAIVAAVVAAGGPDYAYFDIPPADNQDGGQPGGNIRNGYLYRPDRVSLTDSARVLDPDLGDGDAFENSRRPLYAEFEFNGEAVHIINVHFRSKGGGTPVFGAIQPPVNGGVIQREAQAQVVNDFVDALLAAGDDRVVVLGDVNEWEFETPLAVLKGDPSPVLSNMTETLTETERYTFVFQGNSSALDHILLSDALLAGAEYDIVHANAEFLNPATDHDGAVVRLVLAVDSDADGIADTADNCTAIANANQRDTDGDDIGNACDPDVAQPNDCFVNFIDLNVYSANFFQSGDLDTDNNGDGQTNFIDLNLVADYFFSAPGPSAAGCN